MLTATTSHARPGATRPPTVQVVVRRRQVLSVLLAGTVACALGAVAGMTALWWAAAFLGAVAAGYVVLVARLRHLRVRRRMDLAFGFDDRADEFDWRALERELHLTMAQEDVAPHPGPIPSVEVGNRALGRFLVCWALGWVLTPIVTVIRLVRGDLSILERHSVAHRIVRLQQYGRSQSLRLLTVGAAASVTITAVGGLAATASASPIAAAVSTTTQAARAPGASAYTVMPGDTLSAIAHRTGSSVEALAATNHLANPNFILPGEVLSITGSAPAVATAAATTTGTKYVVRAGDTLSAIAASHGTSAAALASANGIADPNRIFPGQALTVPSGSAPAHLAPAAPTTAASSMTHYVVRPGDTMSAVAQRLGTTVAALSAANHIVNANLIYPGQVLAVPVPAGVLSATPAAATPAPATPATATPAAASTASAAPPVTQAPAPAPAPAPAVVAKATPAALPLPAQYLAGGSVDQGVDYAAPGGTPLYAMGPGTIIREGMDGFGPDCPVLQITAGPLAGKTVYYGHAGPDLVPVGATVAAGQQISIVGYGIVGYSTGPHLEVGFYPPGGNGSGQAMLDYINGVVGHSTAG